MVCRSVYYSHDRHGPTVDALDAILYKRIVVLPQAHRVAGGDWQAEPDACRFGNQLRDLGWLSHGDLCGALPPSTPPVGACWMSPNMKAFVTNGV